MFFTPPPKKVFHTSFEERLAFVVARMFFFVDASGGQSGPVPASTLASMLQQGDLNGNSLAWKEGMPAWTPLAQIPEIAAAAPAHPAPGNRQPPMGGGPPAAQAARKGGGPRGAREQRQPEHGGWKARKTVDGGAAGLKRRLPMRHCPG